MTAQSSSLVDALRNYWWLAALRGAIFATYGILIFVWKEMAPLVMVVLFAAYLLITGLILLKESTRQQGLHMRNFVLPGVICILASALAFLIPAMTALAVIGLFALWSIVIGLMELLLSFQLKKSTGPILELFLAGLLSSVVGLSLLIWPLYLTLIAPSWIGLASLILGGILIGLATQMRQLI